MTTAAWLPPEWVHQAAVQLTWPHAQGDWGDDLDAAQACLLQIARSILRFQPLLITCADAAQCQQLAQQLQPAGQAAQRLLLATLPSNDVWARDHGPLTVVAQGQRRLLNLNFNGWGGKYPAQLDNALTRQLHQHGHYAALGIEQLTDLDYILEGGAIEVNGDGSLLTTSRCLLAPTRNPALNKVDYEALFAQHFGIQQVHWLEHGGLDGDDTDGHIDTLARYYSSHGIVYQACDDRHDSHHPGLQAMAQQLQSLRHRDGSAYQLHALPWPSAQFDASGRRLPATYANFLIINGAVLLPVYACAADRQAQAVLQSCFPNHAIIPIDCRALIRQGGSLHCVSMQIPAAQATQASALA